MKRQIGILAALALLTVLGAGTAEAQHRGAYGGFHGGYRGGWYGGWGWYGAWGWAYPWAWGWPYYWAWETSPYYGYPYPVAAEESYVTAPPTASWYYCDNPQGYYPYVASCNGPWRAVPVTPPQ